MYKHTQKSHHLSSLLQLTNYLKHSLYFFFLISLNCCFPWVGPTQTQAIPFLLKSDTRWGEGQRHMGTPLSLKGKSSVPCGGQGTVRHSSPENVDKELTARGDTADITRSHHTDRDTWQGEETCSAVNRFQALS